MYHAPGVQNGPQIFGGAMLLIDATLRSSQLTAVSEPEFQSVSATVENLVWTTVYQPPQQPRIPFLEHCFEIQFMSSRHCPWVCVGDFNDTPSEQFLLENEAFPGLSILAAKHPISQQFLPTRWEGTRCIDYYITSCPDIFHDVALSEEAIADHKILTSVVFFHTARSREHPFRFQKAPNLAKPEETPIDQWFQSCHEFLNANPAPSLPNSLDQQTVDQAWKSLSLYYHSMLYYAKKLALRHLGKEFRCYGVKNSFRLTNNMPRSCKLDHDSDSFEIRKLRNLAAKLQEANRLYLAAMTDSDEYVNLMKKIRRSSFYDPSLSLSQHIGTTLAQLEQARKTFKTYNIKKWKTRMQQSASQCYKWLKALTFAPFQGLVSSTLNKLAPTACITESLELIRDHWHRVWHRPELNFDAAFNAVDAEIDALPNPRHVRAWKPLTQWQLRDKAVKMNNKAAGPDGWLGSELATLPPEAFIPFADFCSFCEKAQKLPSDWRYASQVHLPKGSKGLRQDNARDVTGLRPITLFSVWYRLWAASRLQCSDCQAWLSSWWPPFATGGKKGHEIYHALIPLINAAAKNQYIISLDFSLAFDNCHPQLALHVLSKLDLPPFMCSMLMDQWTNQRRFISFQNFVLPTAESVGTSLPQGDPWSLLAMVAVLCPAMWEIDRTHPQVTQRNFVDDRSWGAPTVAEALNVFSIWERWSAVLGLQENKEKTQFYHAQAAGRRALCRHGIPAANVTDKICVLGHIFRPLQQKSLNAKEKERISSTLALIRRAACLPLPMCQKRLVISVGPMSKVQFGWLMHVPPIAVCDSLQIAIRKALNEPKRSCIFLRDILRGHNLHVGFRMLQTCVSAIFRFSQRCPLPEWTKLGVSGSLSTQFSRMGWLRTNPWTWRHPDAGKTISLDPNNSAYVSDIDLLSHRLREGFRAYCYTMWQNTDRNDAAVCRDVPYSEISCQAARKLSAGNAHAFAIMSGGYVSQASLQNRTGLPITCPCGQISTMEHEIWECPYVPEILNRPRTPSNPIQMRLGWPIGNTNDEAVLAWMIACRKRSLALRYKPPR